MRGFMAKRKKKMYVVDTKYITNLNTNCCLLTNLCYWNSVYQPANYVKFLKSQILASCFTVKKTKYFRLFYSEGKKKN